MEAKPAQVSQATFSNLRTEAARMMAAVAVRAKWVVHRAWVERALRPVATPMMPEPVQRT